VLVLEQIVIVVGTSIGMCHYKILPVYPLNNLFMIQTKLMSV